MIKFIEVRENNKYTGHGQGGSSYYLREVYINPQHVVCIREDKDAKRFLQEGLMPTDLDRKQDFTRIQLNRGQNGIDITVIGTPGMVETQLNTGKQLLKG